MIKKNVRVIKKERKKVIRTIFLCGLMLIVSYPLIYTFVSSFMSNHEISLYESIGRSLLHLIPDHITLEQYEVLLLKQPKYLNMFWNTCLMCSVIVGGQLMVSLLAGYGLSKFQFPGRDFILYLLIIIMIMPVQVTIVPQYIVIKKLHLMGSLWAVMLPAIFHPFGAFLLAQYMKSIPGDLFEVAEIEGANKWIILRDIVIPLSKGGMVALSVLTLIDGWNLIEQPLVFLDDMSKYPLSLFLAWVRPEDNAGTIYAASILFTIPILLLFLYNREDLIEGISYSCIKG